MKSRFPYGMRCVACIVLLAALSSLAHANAARERTQFGHDVSIGPNEDSGEITCFGCNVRVRGHVNGDITVFGGSVQIEGQGNVDGDMAVFAGGLRLERETKVKGDLAVFGGRIQRDPGAEVGGDTTDFAGPVWIFVIFALPLIVFSGIVAAIVLLVRRLTRPSLPVAA